MKLLIENSWRTILKQELQSSWYAEIVECIEREYAAGKTIYPEHVDIFRAFDMIPFENVKVVILGQDPYHGPGQAQGLSFSVSADIPNPPSLRNIFKEIESDLGTRAVAEVEGKGDLSRWAQQGVLLLNSSLTVEEGKPMSHSRIGWHKLTDAAIHMLSEQREDIVFMLWGGFARNKKSLIDSDKHLILEAPHPSPLSAHRGFFGCGHFSRCDDYLGSDAIQW